MELMVSLAITGMVVLLGYATFASAIDRRASEAAAMREVASATSMRRLLIQWLDGATPQIPEGAADPSVHTTLRVTTYHRTPLHTPQATVTLAVDDGRAGYGHGLVAILRANTGTDSLRVILDTTVTAMRFWYAIQQGANTLAWVLPGDLGAQMPVMVRLQFRSIAPHGNAVFTRPLDIPVASTKLQLSADLESDTSIDRTAIAEMQ